MAEFIFRTICVGFFAMAALVTVGLVLHHFILTKTNWYLSRTKIHSLQCLETCQCHESNDCKFGWYNNKYKFIMDQRQLFVDCQWINFLHPFEIEVYDSQARVVELTCLQNEVLRLLIERDDTRQANICYQRRKMVAEQEKKLRRLADIQQINHD